MTNLSFTNPRQVDMPLRSINQSILLASFHFWPCAKLSIVNVNISETLKLYGLCEKRNLHHMLISITFQYPSDFSFLNNKPYLLGFEQAGRFRLFLNIYPGILLHEDRIRDLSEFGVETKTTENSRERGFFRGKIIRIVRLKFPSCLGN